MSGNSYGWTVRRGHPYIPDPDDKDRFIEDKTREGWHVSLPHQCETWDITDPDYEMTQKQAQDALREFLLQGVMAWKALGYGEQYGDEE